MVMTSRLALMKPPSVRELGPRALLPAAARQAYRKKLMCERQRIPIDAIVRHELPPRQSLFVLAAAIGERSLRHLDHERVRDVQHHAMKGSAGVDGFPQSLGLYSLTMTCELHIGFVRYAVVVLHHDGHPSHAFSPDNAEFDLASTVGYD